MPTTAKASTKLPTKSFTLTSVAAHATSMFTTSSLPTTDKVNTQFPTGISTTASVSTPSSSSSTILLSTTAEATTQLITTTSTHVSSREATRVDKSTSSRATTPSAHAKDFSTSFVATTSLFVLPTTKPTVTKRVPTSKISTTQTQGSFSTRQSTSATGRNNNRNENTGSGSGRKIKFKLFKHNIIRWVAAAIGVIVLIATIIVVFLYCRRRATKLHSDTSRAHLADRSRASSGVVHSTRAGAHFTKRGSTVDMSVYCDPTTAIMNQPKRASMEGSWYSSSIPNGTTAVAHFSKRGATMDVSVYCEPTTAMMNRPKGASKEGGWHSSSVSTGATAVAHFSKRGSSVDVGIYCEPTTIMMNKPTGSPIDMAEDKDQYLACAVTKNVDKMQLCNQQTDKSAAIDTTNEDEFQEAKLVTDKASVERKAKHAEVVTANEGLVKSVNEGSTAIEQGFRNMAYQEDTETNELETTSNEENTPTSVSNEEEGGTFWEPASTERELYGQLEERRFKHIDRRDVTDGKEIGSGEFGVVEKAVWQVNCREKLTVAVKTLAGEAKPDDRVSFLREAAINGQFRHKNVVHLHGVVTIGSPIMLVLEYMQNGDLKNYLTKQRQKLSGKRCPSNFDKTLLNMCRDIASGMEYLSSKAFVHRDVAARNVLLNDELTCKIADFGMARDVADDNYYTAKNKQKLPIKWCAPETWNYNRFSSASDVWSYGVVVYEVWAMGQRPFGVIKNQEVMNRVESGHRLPPPPGCSRSLYHIMIDCWHPDRYERPSFGKIVQRLGVSDDLLLSNKKGETAIKGKLGDTLDVSQNCYTDLQHIYAKY